MAGTKKKNKNHKYLIAENRFKKTSISSVRNKSSQKKNQNQPPTQAEAQAQAQTF